MEQKEYWTRSEKEGKTAKVYNIHKKQHAVASVRNGGRKEETFFALHKVAPSAKVVISMKHPINTENINEI